MSVIEGSIGAFPRRLLVDGGRVGRPHAARSREAGLEAWLIDDGECTRLSDGCRRSRDRRDR